MNDTSEQAVNQTRELLAREDHDDQAGAPVDGVATVFETLTSLIDQLTATWNRHRDLVVEELRDLRLQNRSAREALVVLGRLDEALRFLAVGRTRYRTNAEGYYHIQFPRAGEYEISVTVSGFQTTGPPSAASRPPDPCGRFSSVGS